MVAKKFFGPVLFVLCASSVSCLFSQELSIRGKSLKLIRDEFGSDKGVSNLSRGRFSTAASLVDYLESVEDVRIPANTSFSDTLKIYDATKTREVERAFDCSNREGLADDECGPEEVLALLVGFAVKEFINKKIVTLADRNRTLNLIKDEVAAGSDTQLRERNLQEIALLRAEAQTIRQTIQNEIFVALPTLLLQVPEAEHGEFEQAMISESGLLMDRLTAILADQ